MHHKCSKYNLFLINKGKLKFINVNTSPHLRDVSSKYTNWIFHQPDSKSGK